MKQNMLLPVVIAASFAMMLLKAERLSGEVCSLTEREIQSSETQGERDSLLSANRELRDKIRLSEQSVAVLQNTLAASYGESEVLKRKIAELTLRFEALGLDSTGYSGGLEQRLLTAVSDLRIAEQSCATFRKALIELTAAALQFEAEASTSNPNARIGVEAAIQRATTAGGLSATTDHASLVTTTISDGMVIATKEELALVVANVGRRHGAKIGMPLRVMRDEVEVGTVRVVDIRERIAGTVIQTLRSDTNRIRVGDRFDIVAAR